MEESTTKLEQNQESINIECSTSNATISESDGTNSTDSDNSNTSADETPNSIINKRKSRRPNSKLNNHMKCLMGEANLRFARNDLITAQKMCFEIIRQEPEAYEPYMTLAQIHESGDLTKYRGYLRIASYLCRHNPEIWCRLAELDLQENKKKDAIACLSKAVRVDPKNIDLHIKRLNLVEGLGEEKFALSCRRHIANRLPKNQYQKIINICKEVAQKYHSDKNYAKAVQTLEIPFKRVKKRVTQDLVNMMLELLIITERFTQILDILIEFCNFTFEIIVDDNHKINVQSYEIPDNTQIDIRSKFIITLIKLGSSPALVSPLINSIICEENAETVGDLYLDIAEELMITQQHQEALKLLIPLVKSKNFCLAAVWLKYAECLKACNMYEPAVEAYFTVMTMAPQHIEVLYPLAMSLLKLNKKSEALAVLSQDLSSNKLDVGVLMERIKLLKQIGDVEDLWSSIELLLSRHCLIVKYPEEVSVLIFGHTFSEKVAKIKKFRTFRDDHIDILKTYNCIGEPPIEDEYKLYRNILQFAVDQGEFAQLQKLAFMGLSSKRFINRKELHLLALFSCIYNNDSFHGYTLIRELVIRDTENNLLWNLFNLILQKSEDLRHSRFINRFQDKLPNTESSRLLDANYGLSVGNCNFALKYYMKEFKKSNQPYFAFILGVMLLQCCQRNNRKQLASIVSQLFMYYANNRSCYAQNEAYYNLARMYQQLGVMHLAEHYYLKVLKNNEININHDDILSLKYESAYNLHLIYKNGGNTNAARAILIKHIII